MVWLRIAGLAILVAGIIMLLVGLNATESSWEGMRMKITGNYSSRTTQYIIGGIFAIIVGGGMLLVGSFPYGTRNSPPPHQKI